MALNEITKGMSNAAEQINENFNKVVEKEDSGWVRSFTLLNGVTGEINYRKKNGVVSLYGAVTVGGSDRINSAKTFFNIPEGFLPDHDAWLNGVPAPSSTNYPENHAAVLTVATNGNVSIQRASAGSVAYRFDVTYFI